MAERYRPIGADPRIWTADEIAAARAEVEKSVPDAWNEIIRVVKEDGDANFLDADWNPWNDIFRTLWKMHPEVHDVDLRRLEAKLAGIIEAVAKR